MGALFPIHATGGNDGRVETHVAFPFCERRDEAVGLYRDLLWHADSGPTGGNVATFGVGIVSAAAGCCLLYVQALQFCPDETAVLQPIHGCSDSVRRRIVLGNLFGAECAVHHSDESSLSAELAYNVPDYRGSGIRAAMLGTCVPADISHGGLSMAGSVQAMVTGLSDF